MFVYMIPIMKENDIGVKYKDALILTSGNRFFQGEITILPDGTAQIYIYFGENSSYRTGDVIPIYNILVDPSSQEKIFPDGEGNNTVEL